MPLIFIYNFDRFYFILIYFEYFQFSIKTYFMCYYVIFFLFFWIFPVDYVIWFHYTQDVFSLFDLSVLCRSLLCLFSLISYVEVRKFYM